VTITWQDPPARQYNPRIAHLQAAEQLKTKPALWAVVFTRRTVKQAQTAAWSINTGGLKAFAPAGHFEAVARGRDVYARYLGEGQLP
jgi:hypothetical protein